MENMKLFFIFEEQTLTGV